MWRRSGRIEDRARARVDSKAGEAEGRTVVWCTGRALTCSSCPCKVEVDQRWIPEGRLAARIEVGGPRRVHEPTNQEQC